MERCIICGAELPCETGTQYCRTCENKWLKIENEHIRQESVSQSVLKILIEEAKIETAKTIIDRVINIIHGCEEISQGTDDCICEDLREIKKEYGVEVDE